MYVKDSIQCKVLSDLHHEDHEALWADLRPIRLPRGFSNIIVGVVYQPPDANDSAMRDYLVTSLMSLEANVSNCAIILAGDFNRSLLPMVQSAVKAFHLKPTVSFPTRGNNTLDQIFTNFPEFLSAPCSLPPFGLSDHLSVFMGRESGRRPLSLNARSSSPETRDPAKEPVWADFFFKCLGLTFSHPICHVNSSLELSLTLLTLG